MSKQKLSWKLKKEFPASIKYIRHDGNEMNITTRQQVNNIEINRLINRLKRLNIKMYCIKEYLNDNVIADERGMKCLK